MTYKRTIDVFFLLLLICSINLVALTMPPPPAPSILTAKEVRQDLYQFMEELQQFSAFYAIDKPVQQAQLQQQAQFIATRCEQGASNQRFAAEISKLVRLLNDPGAVVTTPSWQQSRLPLKLRPLEQDWLALDNNDHLLDVDYPFITHIDGLPLTRWIKASQAYLPNALKQNPTMQVLWLQKINVLRQDIGLAIKPNVIITLSAQQTDTLANKQSQIQVTLPVSMALMPQINPKDMQFSELSADVALVELTDLNAYENNKSQQKRLSSAMQYQTLVLDIRRAQGVSPTLLKQVSQYADRATSSNIIGLAKYRLSPRVKNDFLRGQNFIPIDSNTLAPPIVSDKHPEFSQWLRRTIDITPTSHPTHQLIALISPECKQDCEWLALSAKTWSRTTLIGEKTAGDLAKRYHFKLKNSQLDIAISASLIFDINGQLLSGVGTEPDINLPFDDTIEWPGLLSLLQQPTDIKVQRTVANRQRLTHQPPSPNLTNTLIK